VTPPELRDLLADSLALWGATGRVTVAEGGVAVTLATLTVQVRPAAPEDLPIRWWLEKPGQRRPASSITGLLRSLRNAAGGADGAQSLRVVPAAAPTTRGPPGA
jgi:hypothetical protein